MVDFVVQFSRLQRQQPQFQANTLRRRVASWLVSGGDDSVTGDHDWKAVRRHYSSHTACRTGVASLFGELAVRQRVAIPDATRGVDHSLLKVREFGEFEDDVVEFHASTQSILFQPAAQLRMPIAVIRRITPAIGWVELLCDCPANIILASVSNKYRRELLIAPEQAKPTEICRKN
jgi:hypothetical protein